MPITLTREDRKAAVRQLGYDPEQWDIDEVTNQLIPVTPSEDTGSPESSLRTHDPVSAGPSPLGSGLRHAAVGVLPSALALKAGVAVGASTLNPLLGLLAAGGTGIVSHMAERKAIKTFAPEFHKQLEKDVEVNPKASFAGGMLSSAPFMVPGKSIPEAAKALPLLVRRGATLLPEQKAALYNVGLGGTVGAGSSVAEDILAKPGPISERLKNISPTKAALGAVIGGASSDPTRIGQRLLGLSPTIATAPRILSTRRAATEDTPLSPEELNLVRLGIEPGAEAPAPTVKTKYTKEELKAVKQQMKDEAAELAVAKKLKTSAAGEELARGMEAEVAEIREAKLRAAGEQKKIGDADEIAAQQKAEANAAEAAAKQEAALKEQADKLATGQRALTERKLALRQAKLEARAKELEKQEIDFKNKLAAKALKPPPKQRPGIEESRLLGLTDAEQDRLIRLGEIDRRGDATPEEVKELNLLFDKSQRASPEAAVPELPSFDEVSKKIGWKSKVKNPTPGSMHGSHSWKDLLDAVLSGRKPVATGSALPPKSSVPEGIVFYRLTDDDSISHFGSYVAVKKGNEDAINNLLLARDSEEVGKALGYTAEEIAEYATRLKMIRDYEKKHGPFYQKEPAAVEALPTTPKATKPSEGWFQWWRNLADEHGIQLERDGTLTQNGKPIAGLAFLRQMSQRALAKINPSKAGFDTPAHEVFHIYFRDMLEGPSKIRAKLAKKALDSLERAEGEVAARIDAIRKANPGMSRREAAEEFLVSAVGEESIWRALGEDTGFKRAMQDIWSNIKARFGPKGSATIDDWKRLYSNKLVYDAPTGARYSKELPVAKPVGDPEVFMQDEPTIPKVESRARVGIPGIHDSRGSEAIMDLDRNGFGISERYKKWLREVKGFSDQEIADLSNRLREAKGIGIGSSLKYQDEPAVPKLEKQITRRRHPQFLINGIHQYFDRNHKLVAEIYRDPETGFWRDNDDQSFIGFSRSEAERSLNLAQDEPVITRLEPLEESLGPADKNPKATAPKSRVGVPGMVTGGREDIGGEAIMDLDRSPGFPYRYREWLQDVKKLSDSEIDALERQAAADQVGYMRKKTQDEPTVPELEASAPKSRVGIPGMKVLGSQPIMDLSKETSGISERYREWLKNVKGLSDDEIAALDRQRAANSIILTRLKKQDDPSITSLDRRPVEDNPRAALPIPRPTEAEVMSAPEVEKQPRSLRVLEGIHSRILHHKDYKNTPEAHYAARTLNRWERLADFNQGRFVELPQLALNEFTPAVRDSYYQKAMQAGLTKQPAKFNAEEQKVENYMRKYLLDVHDEARNMGYKINDREPISEPTYFPSIMSAQVQHVLTQRRHTLEGQRYWKAITDHWKAAELEDTDKLLENYLKAISSIQKEGLGQIEFGALRKAQGVGLPVSVREKDLIVAVSKYGKRVSKDMALFEAVQSDPKAMKILGIKGHDGEEAGDVKWDSGEEVKSLAGVEEINTALQHNMDLMPKHPFTRAVDKLVSNLLMGPTTGLKNLINTPAQALPYVKGGQLPEFLTAYSRGRELTARAFGSRVIRNNMQSILLGDEVDTSSRMLQWFNKMSAGLYQYQQGALEKTSRLWTLGLADIANSQNLARAQAGDLAARKALRTMGGLLEKNRLEELISGRGKSITEREMDMLNKEFVDAVQQTYGPKDQPRWTLEGAYSPFFVLARWSVGKANNIIKHVVNPLVNDGNIVPLIVYAGGTFLNGLALQKLVEILNNKRDFNPTANEVWDAMKTDGRKAEIAAGIINIMQLGSAGGFVSDVLKIVADVGLTGQMPRGYGIPTVTLGVNLVEDLVNLQRAVNDGTEPVEAILAFIKDLAVKNVQSVRLALSHLPGARKEELKRKERYRDLAVFERLTGERTMPLDASAQRLSNPLHRPDIKAFKRAKTVEEGAELLPKLIEKAEQRAAGNIEKFRDEMKTLKGHSYQTMPNPKTHPKDFSEFFQFLVRTQGEQAALEHLTDFMQQNAVDKVKAKLVPSVR
jgi:hypothetical protein